jgi:hypothetical protein
MFSTSECNNRLLRNSLRSDSPRGAIVTFLRGTHGPFAKYMETN